MKKAKLKQFTQFQIKPMSIASRTIMKKHIVLTALLSFSIMRISVMNIALNTVTTILYAIINFCTQYSVEYPFSQFVVVFVISCFIQSRPNRC